MLMRVPVIALVLAFKLEKAKVKVLYAITAEFNMLYL